MWSRKFVAAGLSSATFFAVLSVFAIWLLSYLVLHPGVKTGNYEATVIFEFLFSAAVGVFVYPACWFFMVQRARDYGLSRTLELICATYGISCLIVAAVFCLAMAATFGAVTFMGFLKMIFGSIETNWQALGLGALVDRLSRYSASSWAQL